MQPNRKRSHLHLKYMILYSTTVVSWRVMERPTWSEGICMWNMWCNIHSQLSLEESWRDPHGVKAFACELCDLTFNQSCNLKSYDVAQQEEKPLAFEKCDAIFNHSCQLKIHEATHLEWRHLHVQYVMQHSFTVVIWRVMMQPNRKRSHLHVKNGMQHLTTVVSWIVMKGQRQRDIP